MTDSGTPCSYIYTINPPNPNAFYCFAGRLGEMLPLLGKPPFPLIVLCLGSDRSMGDALGPLVGTMLKGMEPTRAYVYGTLDAPVHALYRAQTWTLIKRSKDAMAAALY